VENVTLADIVDGRLPPDMAHSPPPPTLGPRASLGERAQFRGMYLQRTRP